MSVFPTSLGAPPQITTAALADRTAHHMLERWPSSSGERRSARRRRRARPPAPARRRSASASGRSPGRRCWLRAPGAVGFVSTIIVARLGSADAPEIGRNAVAAASIAGQVHFVAFAVLAAVTIGTTALVARAVGGGDWREADRVLRCSILAGAALAAAMMLATPWARRLVGAFGVEAEVARLGGRTSASCSGSTCRWRSASCSRAGCAAPGTCARRS